MCLRHRKLNFHEKQNIKNDFKKSYRCLISLFSYTGSVTILLISGNNVFKNTLKHTNKKNDDLAIFLVV